MRPTALSRHCGLFTSGGGGHTTQARYALRVGEIDVLVVSDGVLSRDGTNSSNPGVPGCEMLSKLMFVSC